MCRKFAFAANARIKGHPTYLWSTAEFAGAPLECVELVFLELRTGISALATTAESRSRKKKRCEPKNRSVRSGEKRVVGGSFGLRGVVGDEIHPPSPAPSSSKISPNKKLAVVVVGFAKCDYPFSSLNPPIVQAEGECASVVCVSGCVCAFCGALLLRIRRGSSGAHCAFLEEGLFFAATSFSQ